LLSLTLRTWVRYVVPLTLIAAIVMSAVAYTGYAAIPPNDVAQGRAQLHLGWELAATAWIFQFLLVAAAAPLVRSVARTQPLSQPRALLAAIRQVLYALVPVGMAVIAIGVGFVALVVPGVLLLGLLSLTAASERVGEPLPAALEDSIAVVRAHAKEVALVVAIVIAADLALALAAHLILVPVLAKKATTAMLLPTRTFVRVVALGLVALSSLPACALAAVYTRQRAS
jgi:hypothetical protein